MGKLILSLTGWTILALGAGELALVLIGSLAYIIGNSCVSVLFALYLARIEPGNTFRIGCWKLMAVSFLHVFMTILYNHAVRVDVPERLIILNMIGAGAFCTAGIIAATLITAKHVTG